jgi:hypothetical protein
MVFVGAVEKLRENVRPAGICLTFKPEMIGPTDEFPNGLVRPVGTVELGLEPLLATIGPTDELGGGDWVVEELATIGPTDELGGAPAAALSRSFRSTLGLTPWCSLFTH